MGTTAWKGAIAFGLVSVPIKLQCATADNEVTLHQVHAEDGGRIRFKRVCQTCSEQVEYADVAKGYEHGDQTIVLTNDDMADLPLASLKTIAVEQFVKTSEIDALLYSGRVYYIVPEQVGERAYALLANALGTKLAGVARITLRSRERLAVIRRNTSGPTRLSLTLELLHWADEVREPTDLLDINVGVSNAEKRMARELVGAMTGTFDATEHSDSYRTALADLVQAKIDGKPTAPAAKPRPASDLADMLSASLSAARKKGKAA